MATAAEQQRNAPSGGGATASLILADPRDDVRAGIRTALEHHGFVIAADVGTAQEAVRHALHHRAALCLVELDLPGGWVEVIRELRAELPQTRIAVLTTSTSEDDLITALMAGADGYLLKSTAPDRMAEALDALIRGEAIVPRSLTRALIDEIRRRNIVVGGTDVPFPHLLYLPRLYRHYRRRRHSHMPRAQAWQSARARVREYGKVAPDALPRVETDERR